MSPEVRTSSIKYWLGAVAIPDTWNIKEAIMAMQRIMVKSMKLLHHIYILEERGSEISWI